MHCHFLILGQIELDLHMLQYVIRYSTLIFSFDDALASRLADQGISIRDFRSIDQLYHPMLVF